MTTTNLVRKAQAGDLPSREALARLWMTRVYGAALARVGNAVDADDVTQEVFCRVFASLASLREPTRFGPWIHRIVRNVATDQHRRKRPTTTLRADTEGRTPEPAFLEGGVLRAWRRLDGDQRLVCWLKIMDGLPFRDIAELMGSSKSAVYRTFVRGLKRMRKEVARC